MKYINKYYVFEKNDSCCSCAVYDGPLYINKKHGLYYPSKCFNYLELLPHIEYEDLKNQYSLEEKAIANNIKTINVDELIKKIIECPREFYIKICNALTAEERMFLISNLENKNCLNCTNGTCRVEYQEKLGIDEDGNLQGSKCIGWHNEELIGKSKVLRITDIYNLK